MKTWNILIAESQDYSRTAYQILCKLGRVTEKNLTQEELPAYLSTCEILIVRLGLKITKEVINAAPNLQYIASATTGTDHIDVQAAARKGIEIVCLKGETDFLENIPSTAEHTWGLLLSLLRHIPQANEHVRNGGWDRQKFRGNNLSGKKLGILGLGRVGRQVARYALAFGCEVAAFDPNIEYWPNNKISQFQSPTDLLRWCDILCIHIPLNKQTHQFLNKNILSQIKRGALVINTSRSGVWDEVGLVELLESDKIAGVATDVVLNEQDATIRSQGPLLQYARHHDNIIITPHIAGATFESMERTEIFIAERLTKLIRHALKGNCSK